MDRAKPEGREGRPRIGTYVNTKFCVGDEVYLYEPGGRALRGPFLIASVRDSGTYTLSLEDGTSVDDEKAFSEASLEFAN